MLLFAASLSRLSPGIHLPSKDHIRHVQTRCLSTKKKKGVGVRTGSSGQTCYVNKTKRVIPVSHRCSTEVFLRAVVFVHVVHPSVHGFNFSGQCFVSPHGPNVFS